MGGDNNVHCTSLCIRTPHVDALLCNLAPAPLLPRRVDIVLDQLHLQCSNCELVTMKLRTLLVGLHVMDHVAPSSGAFGEFTVKGTVECWPLLHHPHETMAMSLGGSHELWEIVAQEHHFHEQCALCSQHGSALIQG
jgi:hypothetical protein